jgi:hypothetical protein
MFFYCAGRLCFFCHVFVVFLSCPPAVAEVLLASRPGVLQKYCEVSQRQIRLTSCQGQLPWKETLDVTLPHSGDPPACSCFLDTKPPPRAHLSSLFAHSAADTVDDAHDDLKREMSFYAASLNAVLWAQAECDKLHIPHKVPSVVSCTRALYPLIPWLLAAATG